MKLTTRMKSAIRTGAGSPAGYTVCDGRTGAALIRRGLACEPHGYKNGGRSPRLTAAGREVLAQLIKEGF